MDFYAQLEQMRANYAANPKKNVFLMRPSWMGFGDELGVIYKEKKQLLTEGTICYAAVVQANDILFRWAFGDLPANLIYSPDDAVSHDPTLLYKLAQQLYSYKDMPLEQVPEAWREVARVITDERDRSAFAFRATMADGFAINTYFNANMVIRKHLPGMVLRSGLLPVLACPGKCKSVLILPKQYWTEDFKAEWCNGNL